jgi:hypothetical protein
MVTNTNDSGPGSLRQAILDANAQVGADTIDFAIGSGVQTIQVGSTTGMALPTITDSVTIDGTSQPGYAGTPLIELDGTGAGANSTGLTITAASCTVQGLVINSFSRFGIDLQSSSNVIQGNYIGVDTTGNALRANTGGGVVAEASTNTIGGTAAGAGNVIGDGLTLYFADGTLVQGNTIGLGADGSTVLGSPHFGISVTQSRNVVIGGATPAARNVISGNTSFGIFTDLVANGLVIQGNYIGTDRTGTLPRGNTYFGIATYSPDVLIGGLTTTPGTGAGNVISGNGSGPNSGGGISFVLSGLGGGEVVEGNIIGLDATGSTPLNDFQDSGVLSEVPDVTIGGTATGARNVISGNSQGVFLYLYTNYVVEGNYIGTDITGTHAAPNRYGVVIAQASGNIIGGTTEASRNVISGNTEDGVEIIGTGASNNVVEGNYIGTDVSGAAALGNHIGVVIDGTATNNTVGGLTSMPGTGAGNVISGNSTYGIALSGPDTTIQGNLIGLNAAGTAALGNGTWGIIGSAPGDVIGGTTPGAGNVVSGNGADGIWVSQGNTLVQGNRVGTDITGTVAIGNGRDGILVLDTDTVTIGGTANGAGNLISGNASMGLQIDGSTNVLAQGNFIGTNAAGTAALPNFNGVAIDYSSDTTIGGTSAEARNIISGNTSTGVYLSAGASGNLVEGNYVGVGADGATALANAIGVWIKLQSANNTIGGLTTTPGTGAGNVISGNTTFGIWIDSDSGGNLVEGNLVGTDATGLHAVGNSNSGLINAATAVLVSGANNTIGGTTDQARNVVSGNGVTAASGIFITGTGNLIQGNYVGVDITGNAALPNSTGIVSEGSGNTIGGLTASPGTNGGNVVSGNNIPGTVGVFLAEDANDVVEGNIIGLGADGTTPLGNNYGLEVFGASNDTVGGTAAGAGNVVSSNAYFGVADFAALGGTTIAGNLIGTDVTGTLARGNVFGVFVAAPNDQITGNLISGNTSSGLVLGDPGAVVQGNWIGTRLDGLAALPNLADGIYVQSAGNTIGGTAAAARNIISGNEEAGVEFGTATAQNNVLEGNWIGVGSDGTTPVPNTAIPGGLYGYGVWSFDGAANNLIGDTSAGAGNVIAYNSGTGVAVAGASSAGNSIRGNSIHDNGGLGIDLGGDGVTPNDSAGHAGPNNYQNFPVLTDTDLGGGVTLVSGTLDSAPNSTFTLDFYANTLPDPSGYGQGQTYLGSTTVTTDGSGHANFTTAVVAAPAGQQFVSATATDSVGNTSEFSQRMTVTPPSSLSGLVFEDFNNDSQVDFGEGGMAGVTVTLAGTDALGRPVNLSQQTDANGLYSFGNLLPGSYTLTETQPTGYGQGIDTVGTAGGSLVATDQFFVQLAAGVNGLNYNYGERPPAGSNVTAGQTATIGFWQNKNGQALILALNGGSTSTQLGNWLAATLPNVYGAGAGANNLAGKSNSAVAALFQSDFQAHGLKVDAQVLATALAVYVTSATLDPSRVAAQYGFTVSGDGVGAATFNVGADGAAVGAANNSTMTVMDLLLAVNQRAVNGVLYNGDQTLRSEANDLFSAINQAGDIS